MRNTLSYVLFLLLSLIMLGCGGGAAEQGSDAAPEQAEEPTLAPSGRSIYLEEKGLASPESIIKHEETYYISNVGKELLPSEKDGDGFISRMDAEGNPLEGNFVSDGLDAPKGMAILNGVLWVADIDKLKGFTLASGEPAGEIDFSSTGTQFLNDVEVKSESELFVSATDINKIFTVKAPGGEPEELVTSPTVQKPNGLAYDASKNLLYVATYPSDASGVVGVIEMKSKANTFSVLSGSYTGLMDGLQLLGDLLFFTDWNRGALLLLNIPTAQVAGYPVPLPSSQIQGPADVLLDQENGEFWIPGMQENTVTILTLPQ